MVFVGLSSLIYPQKNVKYIHCPEENFTDALFVEDYNSFRSGFFELFQKEWEEISQSSHFRILNEGQRKTIGKYVRLTKKKLPHLINENIYQIAIGKEEEFRLFVIKRKKHDKDILEIVLFDPNHLFFPDRKKAKYPYGEEAVCWKNLLEGNSIEEKMNCFGIEEEPKDKWLIRKKSKEK